MTNDTHKDYVTIELPVQWGDMDAAQHINNTVYLRWVESARVMMFQKMLGETAEFKQIIPILAWQDCKYLFPVTYQDTMVMTLNVLELYVDKLVCETTIHSKRHDRIVALSQSRLIPFDRKAQKKETLPQSWRKSFIDFYGEGILR